MDERNSGSNNNHDNNANELTNKVVWEWYVESGKELSITDLFDEFVRKFGVDTETFVNKNRLKTKLNELYENGRKFSKRKSKEKYNNLMKECFITKKSDAQSTNFNMERCREEKKTLKRKLTELQTKERFSSAKCMKNEALFEKASKENEELVKNMNMLKQKSEAELNKMKTKLSNERKENKRLIAVNESLKNNMKQLETSKNINISKMRVEKKKLQRQLKTLQNLPGKDRKADIEKLEKLDKEVKELNRENRELEQLVEILKKDEIITFEDGKYTNEIREVVMELIADNVSIGRINNVITTVLKLTSQKIQDERLPSTGTKCRILKESLHAAMNQVGTAMTEGGIQENAGNVLHGDGTSKYHRHIQNFQITTKSGRSYSFGLTEVASGDVDSTISALEQSIQDLADAVTSNKSDSDKKFAELIASIKTTMSDLGPINPGFNQQLRELRESVLPTAVVNWNNLSSSQKKDLSDMANFFCKLHLLANFATECDKVLKGLEDIMMDGYNPVFAFNTKESGGVRLVRTACKAFHERGCDKSGVGGHFLSFLSGRNEKLYLEHFIGNRFNILFVNAGAVYYHKDAIQDFVKSWPDPNNLLKAVNEDCSHELFLAEIRALGIINKIITGPLWRLIEKADNILALNQDLYKLKMKLSEMCVDASSIFKGGKIFDETKTNGDTIDTVDKVSEKLFESTTADFDVLTQQCLEVALHGILIILERQCEDQLPGGKYWKPNDKLNLMGQNVPTTNKLSEADFGMVDLLIRTKPNLSTEGMLTLIMWSKNKTAKWLCELNYDERNRVMDAARKNYPVLKEKFKQRNSNLIQEKMKMVEKKQNEVKEKKQKADLKKVEVYNSFLELGMAAWVSKDEALDKANKIVDEKMKVKVIVGQLMFNKHILGVQCPANLFNKTKKGVPLSSKELLDSLLQVIEFLKLPSTYQPPTSSLKPIEVRNEAFAAGKKDLADKVQNARIGRYTAIQAQKLLPRLMEEPYLLVGKQIKHLLVDSDGTETWDRGTVTCIEKNNKNVMRTTYSVTYDNDPDDPLSFPLLTDLKKGDLIIEGSLE